MQGILVLWLTFLEYGNFFPCFVGNRREFTMRHIHVRHSGNTFRFGTDNSLPTGVVCCKPLDPVQAWSGCKLFDTLMLFLKGVLSSLFKNQLTIKNMQNFPVGK